MKRGHFPGTHPPSAIVPLSRRTEVILDDGFCYFAFGSAQNDSIGGEIGALKKIKGSGCPVLTEQILLSRSYLTVHHL